MSSNNIEATLKNHVPSHLTSFVLRWSILIAAYKPEAYLASSCQFWRSYKWTGLKRCKNSRFTNAGFVNIAHHPEMMEPTVMTCPISTGGVSYAALLYRAQSQKTEKRNHENMQRRRRRNINKLAKTVTNNVAFLIYEIFVSSW